MFLNLLLQGLFQFSQVNLLIIDEIHHTAKNHPYMQIMKQYKTYTEASPAGTHRPRILGLTASVVTEKSVVTRIVPCLLLI